MCTTVGLSLLTDCSCVSRVTTIDRYTVRLSHNEVGTVIIHVVVVVYKVRLSDIPLGRQPVARCVRGGLVERADRLPPPDAQRFVGGKGAFATYPRIHSQDRSLIRADARAEGVASFTLRNGIRFSTLYSWTVCLYEDNQRRCQSKDGNKDSRDSDHGKAGVASVFFALMKWSSLHFIPMGSQVARKDG